MTAPLIGVLGQGAPAAATNTDLYTVPVNRRAVISTVVACETGAGLEKIRMWVRRNGATLGAANAVAYDIQLDPNGRFGFTEGWALGHGDIVTAYSNNGAVTFTVFGEETDVPTS